ncbi:MAG: sulfatase [Planctomycetota bacterium]
MRVLYFDIDTLRPDHLGCYGYHRETSPNIDRVAREGTVFTNYYASDAPCLPSRAALFLGRPGIHTGVVDHGGIAADPHPVGAERQFRWQHPWHSWPMAMRNCGFYTTSFSPFAERHSAWWFYSGWREMYNSGKGGGERADEIVPAALEWIDQNAERDDWFLHINIWDPHTSYRTPEEYGFPFEDEPIEDWITEEKIRRDFESFGPHGAQDLANLAERQESLRAPAQIRNLDDYTRWINGYDTGIRYADDHFGQVLEALEAKGVLEDTVIIISSDHGENQGELSVYGDHHTSDYITARVPLIIRWPGVEGGNIDDGLHYNYDLPPTLMEMFGGDSPERWDGCSFAGALRGETGTGRDSLVLGNCAWSCQRSVRWEPWVLLRTYHSGMKDFDEYMLFNVEEDPHELNDLAEERPEVVNEGLARLEKWHADMMATSTSTTDPLWTVMSQGGPYHTRGRTEDYAKRLRETGREQAAEWLEQTDGGRLVGD